MRRVSKRQTLHDGQLTALRAMMVVGVKICLRVGDPLTLAAIMRSFWGHILILHCFEVACHTQHRDTGV